MNMGESGVVCAYLSITMAHTLCFLFWSLSLLVLLAPRAVALAVDSQGAIMVTMARDMNLTTAALVLGPANCTVLSALDDDNDGMARCFLVECSGQRGAHVASLLSADALSVLSGLPGVKFVAEDAEMHTTEVPPEERPLTWHADMMFWPPRDNQTSPIVCGRGTTYYSMDTGVHGGYAWEFGGRLHRGMNFAGVDRGYAWYGGDGGGWTDPNGHGTHTASLCCGNIFGVARGAQVVPLRVLKSNGRGLWSWFIQGLGWIKRNAHRYPGKVVVGVSISGSWSTLVNDALDRFVKDKTLRPIVVVAAGNYVGDSCLSSPSGAKRAIVVGAVDYRPSFASFSGRGKCVDILAPGVAMLAADVLGGGQVTGRRTGTSMAQPMVAGAMLCEWSKSGRRRRGALGGRREHRRTVVKRVLVQKSIKDEVMSVDPGTVNRLVSLGVREEEE